MTTKIDEDVLCPGCNTVGRVLPQWAGMSTTPASTETVPNLQTLARVYLRRLVQAGVPEHLHRGFVRYLVHRIAPGDFLTAVLENNLSEAMHRADEMSRAGLYEIVVFLFNDVPGNAWGTPAKVQAWLTRSERNQ